MSINRKPWEEYPHIWKTEAQFWTYVRGGLRRGLWEKSPIKLDYKNSNVGPPPSDYIGRGRKGAECSLSGVWTMTSKLEVDHKQGNVPVLGWNDLTDFITHIIPPPGSLQLVDKEMHKVKSYAERQGIPFEEALKRKCVIKIMRGDFKSFLSSANMEPEKTKAGCERQLTKIVKGFDLNRLQRIYQNTDLSLV